MLAIAGGGCTGSASLPEYPTGFDEWQRAHAADVAAYRRHLARQGVAEVVPMEQLLRTGRRWRACGTSFRVPPRVAWPAMVPTLRLLATLRASGDLAGDIQVASAYRTPEFNRCEGGASRSRHLANAALDLDWDAPAGSTQRLCAAWRRLGPKHRWGLGFYTGSRIHLDTRGFRTWGPDYTAKSSACLRIEAAL